MKVKFFSNDIGFFDLVVGMLLIVVFYFMSFVVSTDIPLHAQFIKDYAYGNKPFQVNFLYYLTVYTFAFFAKTTSALLVVSVYVLAAATFAKYLLAKKIILSRIVNSTIITRVVSIACLFLLLCFSLPTILYYSHNFYYLLSYPSNVWHNSTTIFVMPFALLLYWLSVQQFTDHKNSRLPYITILVILNVLIKPSFLFVYLIIFPFLLLKRYKLGKYFWLNILPLAIAALLIAIEYYYIFVLNESGSSGKVVISYFHFINTWAANGDMLYICAILLSTLVSSFLFPMVVLVKNQSLLKEYNVQFAVWGVFLALIIANIFAETGARASDGNFLWQSFICTFILFFICLFHLVRMWSADSRGWKAYLFEITAFTLHVLAGLFYFVKIWSTLSYF